MSAELPTGTLTFLFTDVEGSTRLLNKLGSAYADVLIDQQRLLRATFAQAGGREIDTQGDAFFVVFPRAKDALAGALEAQRSLRRHSWPEGVEVRVRMGMHTGEPGIAGDRYFGLGVHRAARICAAGHGGQLLLSQSTYSVLADDVLPDIRRAHLPALRPRPAAVVPAVEGGGGDRVQRPRARARRRSDRDPGREANSGRRRG
jgi:class 3 adenylate cyclase